MTRQNSSPDEAPASFDELYQRHWWSMVRLAVCLVDEVGLAEDVAQDAFAGLFRQWSSMRDRRAAVSYLRTAVVNRSRSALRRRRTARKHLQAVPENAESADHGALLSADHQLVRTALSALPPRQREVLTLRYLIGLGDAEIATVTGLSQVGVRSASSRGLATLRTTLGGVL